MNTKLLKLALDSGLINYVDHETPRVYFICGHADIEEVEKFAELIVRECMECSDPLIRSYIDKHPEQEQAFLLAAIADYSSEIKKHFGVEEK